MDKFSIQLPLSGEYFTTVRLTTGGICALAEFDVDATEDFKVCVTESLLILKRNGFTSAEISFTIGEAVECVIRGKEQNGEKEAGLEDSISYALLNALLGNVEFEKTDDRVVGVRFVA